MITAVHSSTKNYNYYDCMSIIVCAGGVKYFGPSHMREQCKYV